MGQEWTSSGVYADVVRCVASRTLRPIDVISSGAVSGIGNAGIYSGATTNDRIRECAWRGRSWPKPATAHACYATFNTRLHLRRSQDQRTTRILRRTRLVIQRQYFVVLRGGDLNHARSESGRVRLDVGVGRHRIDTLYSDGQRYAARPFVNIGE